MRALVLLASVCAACTFSVRGTDGNPPSSPPLGDAPAAPPTSGSVTGADGGASVGNGNGGGNGNGSGNGSGTTSADLATVAVGAPCLSDADCGGMQCLHSFDEVVFPDGYCTMACDTKVCPTGSLCAGYGTSRLCLATCGAGGCRTGYSCCPQAVCAPVNACDG
jgi:hypothetical protein